MNYISTPLVKYYSLQSWSSGENLTGWFLHNHSAHTWIEIRLVTADSAEFWSMYGRFYSVGRSLSNSANIAPSPVARQDSSHWVSAIESLPDLSETDICHLKSMSSFINWILIPVPVPRQKLHQVLLDAKLPGFLHFLASHHPGKTPIHHLWLTKLHIHDATLHHWWPVVV